jgi:hypothetical protein
MNKHVLTQYDKDAQDFEEVVPKQKAKKVLNNQIDKMVKDKLKSNKK